MLRKHFVTKQDVFNKVIDLNLLNIKTLIEKEIVAFIKVFSLTDLKILNKNIANVLYLNSIAYDTNILKSVDIKIIF